MKAEWTVGVAVRDARLNTHVIAIAALLLIIIALFWRVFFLGETMIDLAAHENQLPWGARTSTFNGYGYNRRDLTDTYVTRDYFVVDSYRRRELPLWNPYILSGHPSYADGVTKLFAPTNLLYFWFDVPLGYSLGRLIELALAAVFLYLFLVNLKIGPGGAFAGSTVFLLSDHVMQHLTWLGWLGGLMWLPLMLLGADRAMRGGRALPAVGAGIALAMQFYCGFMPAAIYYVAALAAYYLAMPWLIEQAGNRVAALKRAGRYLAISLIVGFGLSATIWLPVFELLSYSNRKIVPTELGYIWLPPWQLLTLLLPRAFGQAFDPKFVRMFVEMGVSQDRSVYLGLVALPFIGLALWRPRDRRVYYFAGLVIGALLVVTCAPIYVHVTKYLPVLRTIRAITRISVLYAFGGAVLVAYGVDRLLAAERSFVIDFVGRIRRIGLWWLGVLIGAILLFGAMRGHLPQDVESGNRIRRWGLKIATSLGEQFRWSWNNFDLLVPLVVLVSLLILCWYFPRSRWSPVALLCTMAVLLAGELIWNGSQYNATFPRELIYSATATTDFLKANIGQYRLVVAPAELGGKTAEGRKIVAPPNTLVPYQLATISGKDQLYPRWYRDLAALVEPQDELSHIIFNRQRSPLYDLLGVKYLMTKEENGVQDAEYREAYRGDGVRVYENLAVMPRAFFAQQVRLAARPEEALALMKQDGFDPHTTAIAESSTLAADTLEAPAASDRVEIASYKNNEVILRASSAGARLLVLTDTYYPGWEAFVDGAPAELLRVNYALRGVALKSGEHQVQFIFRPRSLRNGLAISAAMLLICVGMLAERYFNQSAALGAATKKLTSKNTKSTKTGRD